MKYVESSTWSFNNQLSFSPIQAFVKWLSTTTFAASLASTVTLGALQLRVDVHQRSAASGASWLAWLSAPLNICFYGVSASIVLLLGHHGIASNHS